MHLSLFINSSHGISWSSILSGMNLLYACESMAMDGVDIPSLVCNITILHFHVIYVFHVEIQIECHFLFLRVSLLRVVTLKIEYSRRNKGAFFSMN